MASQSKNTKVKIHLEGLDYYPQKIVNPDTVTAIERLWESERKFIILSGPPGTGKSRSAEDYINKILRNISSKLPKEYYRVSSIFPNFRSKVYSDEEIISKLRKNDISFVWDFTVLHPNYTYEDLIRGYRISEDQSNSPLEVKEGMLGFISRVTNIIQKTYGDKTNNPCGLLVMDEINRAPIGQLFGEAFYAIDRRDTKVTTPYDLKGVGSELLIPNSLLLLGTMNSVDRATAGFDFALRRRITSITVPPRRSAIESYYKRFNNTKLTKTALKLYDQLYTAVMNSDQVGIVPKSELIIGHTYFLPSIRKSEKNIIKWLAESYLYKILPTLIDYSEQGLLSFPDTNLPFLNELIEGEKRLEELLFSEIVDWIDQLVDAKNDEDKSL